MRAQPQALLLLAPQLYGSLGGVQAYMRRLLEISSSYSRDRGHHLDCLSLGDESFAEERHSRQVTCRTFTCCQASKLLFVINAIRLTWNSPCGLAVVGHIGLAPVAWGLKRLGLVQSYILVIYGIEVWKEVSWLDRLAAQGARCIVAITQYTAQEFCKHNGIPLSRVQVIPPTLAEEKIEIPDNGQGIDIETSVLTVGRLSWGDRYKGFDTLIKAIERARAEGAKVRLTVVGDGDDLPRLKELALHLELNGCVEFLGAVSDERLQLLYKECDVFALPSKGEGFGIVFIEAMRYGKPCIGGNHGGTPEVITNGIDGYLVNSGDVDKLAWHLMELFQKPALRWEMGRRAFEMVRSVYLFPHMRDKWFALLDEVLDRG